MTFWKLFDGCMIFSWNFMTFRSDHRIFFKKSSEVNQRRFNNPLTSYFGFMTIRSVFSILSSFPWFLMFFLQKIMKKKIVFFFKNHGNELRIENTHRIVMRPKYDVNGLLKRLWVTSDDFLKTFRRPHDFFMKFHDISMRPSNFCQKVIRSHTHVP